jgi:hypothetical protein
MQSAAMKARALQEGRGEHGIEKFDSEASALGLTTQSMWHTACEDECQRFEQMYGKDETKWPSQGPDHCSSAECAALKMKSGQSTALASALASAFAHGEALDATTRGRQQQKAASRGNKAPAPTAKHLMPRPAGGSSRRRHQEATSSPVYSAHWIRGQHVPSAHSAASGELSTCGCGGCPPCPYGSLAARHLRKEASAALGTPQLATASGAAAGAAHSQQQLARASRSESHAEALAETEAHAEAEDRERERETERERERERERETEREREREKAQAEEMAHVEVAAAMIKGTAHKQVSREAAATQLRKQHAARAPAPTDAAALTHAAPVNVTADAGWVAVVTHAAAPVSVPSVESSAPEHPLLEWICTSAGGCQAAAKASSAAAQAVARVAQPRPHGAHGAGIAQVQGGEEEETDYKEEMEEEQQQQQQLRQENAQTKDGMQATQSHKSSA